MHLFEGTSFPSITSSPPPGAGDATKAADAEDATTAVIAAKQYAQSARAWSTTSLALGGCGTVASLLVLYHAQWPSHPGTTSNAHTLIAYNTSLDAKPGASLSFTTIKSGPY